MKVGETYKRESEWIVKSSTFIIPDGSRLLIKRPNVISDAACEAYLSGGKDAYVAQATKEGAYPEEGNIHAYRWDNMAKRLELVKQHGLDRRYRVVFLTEEKFEAAQSQARRRQYNY